MDHFANDSLSHDDEDDWPMGTSEGGQVLSEGEMKEKVKNVAKKYLKKIKTLQQNKRRQDTRIERLTRENRTLREKISIQAAYIDVLCGLLGEDVTEKFKGRQGLGILGGDTCSNRVDRKESVVLHGAHGAVDSLDDKHDLCSVGGLTVEGMVGSSAVCHLNNLDASHHPSNFPAGLLLDHEHSNNFVTGLEDNQENHLYCIEDISEQDRTSLFIC